MSNVQHLARTQISERSDAPLSESMTARVVEVGEITAGIAVPEHGGVRFYSSTRTFDGLDGQLFRSFEQANRAARDRARVNGRSSVRRTPPQLEAV